MRVLVTIIQKVDGLHYDGTIQVGERTFNWEIHFGAPIPKILSQEAEVNCEDGLRKLFSFTMKADGNKVEIGDDLFMFLLQTVVVPTMDFYQAPQTRDFNGGSIQFRVRQYSQKLPNHGMETSYEILERQIPSELMAQ